MRFYKQLIILFLCMLTTLQGLNINISSSDIEQTKEYQFSYIKEYKVSFLKTLFDNVSTTSYYNAEESTLLGHTQADIDVDDFFISNTKREAPKHPVLGKSSDVFLHSERYTLQYCFHIVPPPPKV